MARSGKRQRVFSTEIETYFLRENGHYSAYAHTYIFTLKLPKVAQAGKQLIWHLRR